MGAAGIHVFSHARDAAGVHLFSLSVFGTGCMDGFAGMLVMYGLFNGIGQ